MGPDAKVVAGIRRVRRRERLFGLVGPALPAGSPRWGGGAPVLLYHRIGRPGERSDDPFLVPLDAFERQVAWLADRFTLVTVGELVERLARGEGPGLAAVSFDDGYACTVSRALPVLEARGLPMTVFVDTGRLEGPAPALREADLLTLVAAGAEIGSHSVTHRDLTRLSDADLRAELEESRARLSGVLGHDVAGFAPPFGFANERITRAIRAAGYTYACTCRQDRTNRPGDDPFQLARIEINMTDTPRRFHAKLEGRYAPLYAAWYRIQDVIGVRQEAV